MKIQMKEHDHTPVMQIVSVVVLVVVMFLVVVAATSTGVMPSLWVVG